MTNEFYNKSGWPTTGSPGASASARAELTLIAAGFDKMPALTGNTGKAVVIGSGNLSVTTGTLTLAGNFATSGTSAITLTSTGATNVTLPTTGTLATLAGSETLTNKTLTAPVIATITNTGTLTLPTSTDTLVGRATTDTLTNKTLTAPAINGTVTTSGLTLPAYTLDGTISGGGNQINNVIIGASTPLAGSFTTLSASGDFAVNTDKFTVTASSGATAIAGTLSPAALVDISGASAGQIKFPSTQNASSNANTLDDYVESSFTGTLTGTSGPLTGTITYTKIGNLVVICVPNLQGTSTTTSKTITGMPAAIRPASGKVVLPFVSDNGGGTTAGVASLDSAGVITLYSSTGLGGWTASGTVTINAFEIAYTLA